MFDQDQAVICSKCCADIRNNACTGCEYYASSERYQSNKIKKIKSFTTMIDPELDEKVDEVLEMCEKGNLLMAELRINTLLEAHPNYHMCLYAKGVIHAFNGETDDALVYFDKAIAIFPPFREAFYNKATCHQERVEIPQMVKSFQEVIKLSTEQDDIYHRSVNMVEGLTATLDGITLDQYLTSTAIFDTAFKALKNKNHEVASELFKQVLAIDNKAVQAYGNLGLCYSGLGLKEKALAAFDKAITLDPLYEPAILNREIVLKSDEKSLLENFKNMGEVQEIKYYKDYGKDREKGSLLQNITDEIKQ